MLPTPAHRTMRRCPVWRISTGNLPLPHNLRRPCRTSSTRMSTLRFLSHPFVAELSLDSTNNLLGGFRLCTQRSIHTSIGTCLPRRRPPLHPRIVWQISLRPETWYPRLSIHSTPIPPAMNARTFSSTVLIPLAQRPPLPVLHPRALPLLLPPPGSQAWSPFQEPRAGTVLQSRPRSQSTGRRKGEGFVRVAE